MSLVKSQHIFLDSSKASQITDQAWKWTAHLEPGLVQCHPQEEYMTVTLERFSTVADWDWIPAGTCFTVMAADQSGGPAYEVTVQLPVGNPRLSKVAEAISDAVRYVGVQCAYDQASNKLIFLSAYGLQLRFPTLAVAKLLGFTEVDVGPSYSLTSAEPIRPLPVDTIAVHLLGVCPVQGGVNCTNILPGSNVTPCHILGVLAMTASPYTMLDWQNPNSAFTTVLADKSLSNLTFLLTDWAGEKLTKLGQHYLTLRVDTYR